MTKMVIDAPAPSQQIKWSLRQGDNGVHLVGHDGKTSKTVIEIRDDGFFHLIGYAELNGLKTEEGVVVTIVDD